MNEFFDIVRPLVEFQFNSILSRCLTSLPFRANFLNPHLSKRHKPNHPKIL